MILWRHFARGYKGNNSLYKIVLTKFISLSDENMVSTNTTYYNEKEIFGALEIIIINS